MHPYCARSGIRQGWRGRADSRLTAGINHLPCQPDASWQEGASSLEWWLVHSLSEMSFCQPVSGGMLSVINSSNHLSINYFSRVRPICDMLHFTAMLRSCGTASLIFSVPTGCICLRGKKVTHLTNIPSACHHNTEKSWLTRHCNRPYLLKMEKNHLNLFSTYSQAPSIWMWRHGSRSVKVDYKSLGKSWDRIDWNGQKLNNASPGQLDRQEKDTALSLRNFHWLKLTDAEHSRQLELTLNKSRFHILHYIGNSSTFPDDVYLMFTV